MQKIAFSSPKLFRMHGREPPPARPRSPAGWLYYIRRSGTALLLIARLARRRKQPRQHRSTRWFVLSRVGNYLTYSVIIDPCSHEGHSISVCPSRGTAPPSVSHARGAQHLHLCHILQRHLVSSDRDVCFWPAKGEIENRELPCRLPESHIRGCYPRIIGVRPNI